jgi:N-acetylmuramoyl-L-alanine amidase
MALKRVAIPSPNYSSRAAAGVRLVVIHASEGATTYRSLGNFFASPSSGVSSHTGIDDTPGEIGEYVQAGPGKAWTAGNANGVAVQTELCVPSGASMGWTRDQWNQHPTMLANCAQWVAEECARFGLPIVALSPADAQGSGRGVCQHKDLGAWGGGHSDCGPNFPMSSVIQMAGGAPQPAPPTPTPSTSEENMVLTDPTTGGLWVVSPDTIPAAIWTYGGAPYLGATNSTKFNAGKYPCVGIAAYRDNKGDGYTLVLDWGDSGKGDGKCKDGSGDRYRRYSFPRDGSGK